MIFIRTAQIIDCSVLVIKWSAEVDQPIIRHLGLGWNNARRGCGTLDLLLVYKRSALLMFDHMRRTKDRVININF